MQLNAKWVMTSRLFVLNLLTRLSDKKVDALMTLFFL